MGWCKIVSIMEKELHHSEPGGPEEEAIKPSCPVCNFELGGSRKLCEVCGAELVVQAGEIIEKPEED